MKRRSEELAGVRLEVECLEDLNRTIDELFERLEREGNPSLLEELCPYFGVVWPSARALALWLAEQDRGSLGTQRILEVGCGLAVPSLLAARLGARITATDFHPEVPRFLTRNTELNGVSIDYLRVDWKREAPDLGLFDLVIGSDILYEKEHPALVAPVLARHVAPGGTVVLTDPGRPYLQSFADHMKALGFECRTLARTVHDVPVPKDIFVLELTRTPAS